MKEVSRKIGLVLIVIFALCVVLIANGAIWWGIGNLIIYTFKLSYTWSYLQGFCIGIITFLISPINLKIDVPEIKLETETETKQDEKEETKEQEENTEEIKVEESNIE